MRFHVAVAAAVLALVTVVSLPSTPQAGSPQAQAADRCLDQVTPSKGFQYFSGHAKGVSHNHPAMYAHGFGDKARIVVLARGTERSFAMKDFSKAVASYEAALRKNSYQPGK